MKYIHVLVAVLFLWFAYVQINDPDPLMWVILYLGVALVATFTYFDRRTLNGALMGMAASFFGFVLLLPDFVSWIALGMPTITGSMKAESPHVELTREFLGFVLAFVVYGIYFIRSIRRDGC